MSQRSFARMKLPVQIPQPVARHVCIKLRRIDARVPQQFLDDSQIRPVFQQVRRKAMPQHVRRDIP